MGANRFMKPVKADYFQTYVNQYVPQPFELMQRAVDNKQKRHDAVNANLEALQTSWGNMKAHSGMDSNQLQEIEKYYMDRTQDILSQGDLSSSEQDVRMLGRAMSEDTELLHLLQGAKKEQDYFDWLKETEKHAIGEGGLSRQRRSYEEALHRRHQELGLVGTGGEFLTRTYKTSADLEALANDYASTMKSSTVEDWAGKYSNDEIDGIHRFLDKNYEELEATDIEKGTMLSLLNNSDAVEELEMRARHNKAMTENKNILDVQIDQSDLYDEAIKAVAPSRIAYAFKKGDTKANLIKAAGYDTKHAEVPGGLFAYKTNYSVDAPGGRTPEEFKNSYNMKVTLNNGLGTGVGAALTKVIKEIKHADPIVKNSNDPSLSDLVGLAGMKLNDPNLVTKLKADIRYGRGIGYGLPESKKNEYLKAISNAVIEKNRLIERYDDSNEYAINSLATDVQKDHNMSLKEMQDEIRTNFFDKIGVKNVKNPFKEIMLFLDETTGQLSKINLLSKKYNVDESKVMDVMDDFNKYQEIAETYTSKFNKYKDERLDKTGVINYTMYVTNGDDLPLVSRGGMDVKGNVILDDFRENYISKKAINKTPILDEKGLYVGEVKDNSKYVLNKLNEGRAEKDKLTKVPEPSGAMIGAHPLNGSAIVTLQYGGDTANPVETIISLDDFISQVGISKTEQASWRAKLTYNAAIKTGVLSSMYDTFGNLVEDEDGERLMSTGENTFIIRHKNRADSNVMGEKEAMAWLARYYNNLNN